MRLRVFEPLVGAAVLAGARLASALGQTVHVEVEDALLQHDAVAECAVIGAPDAERGQIVKAFVVLKGGHATGDATVKALQEFVKATVAPYKYPRAVEFRASLPRTETGKLQRFRLREG